MNCEVASCPELARSHVLFRAGGHAGTAYVCGPCLLSVLVGNAVALGHRAAHVADHPLTPECRHPESVWRGDRCVIDGLSLLEDVDMLEGVPA